MTFRPCSIARAVIGWPVESKASHVPIYLIGWGGKKGLTRRRSLKGETTDHITSVCHIIKKNKVCQVEINNVPVRTNASHEGLRGCIRLALHENDDAWQESSLIRTIPPFVAKGVALSRGKKTLIRVDRPQRPGHHEILEKEVGKRPDEKTPPSGGVKAIVAVSASDFWFDGTVQCHSQDKSRSSV